MTDRKTKQRAGGRKITNRTFHAPVEFPKKALRYVAFVQKNAVRLEGFVGLDKDVLLALERIAVRVPELDAEFKKKRAEVDRLEEAVVEARNEGFNQFMEQLDYARTFAERRGLGWLKKALHQFKAREGTGRSTDKGSGKDAAEAKVALEVTIH